MTNKHRREYLRRYRLAHPEKFLVAHGRPSRAKHPKRPAGQCKACGTQYEPTAEFFVPLKVKMKDGRIWEGLSSECRACRNKRFHPYYKKNRKKIIRRIVEHVAARRLTDPEYRVRDREWSRLSAERRFADKKERAKATARNRKWRKANPDRVKNFKHQHPAIKRKRAMDRYVAKQNATPAWADKRKIETIYLLADYLTKKTGVKYEVDHVYPILGKHCCGLHVPENMRIITADANRAKGNKMPEVQM